MSDSKDPGPPTDAGEPCEPARTWIVAPGAAGTPVRRTWRSWRTWLIGRPLSTADAPHETIGKTVGLAVFASDALSSTAYATQEILVILAAAGMAAFTWSLPIALAIVLLLAIVTTSYEQTIHAYPGGGGAYIVARDNLGELPAQIAGAALLTDYVLTVGRVRLLRGRADHLGLPAPSRAARRHRRGAGGDGHGGQPARRARVGRGLRRADATSSC